MRRFATDRLRPRAARVIVALGLAVALVLTAFEASTSDRSMSFVQRAATELQLDGRPFRFDGLNLGEAGAPCGLAVDIDAALDQIGADQEVARVFAFQETAILEGRRDWSFLDHLVGAFRRHGERLILVLTDQYSGQPCSDSQSDRDIGWYEGGYRTSIEGVSTYRDWVTEVAARYHLDPTILAWQLVNEGEARNADGSCSEAAAARALRAFADDVGELVKSIDGNHLVSLGTIAGECGSNEQDYGYVNGARALDLCDYHDYRFPYSPMGNTDPYNGLRVAIDRCHVAGKALFVGEMGIHFASLDLPTLDRRAGLLDAKVGAQLRAGSVGELLWRWSPTFSDVPPRDQELAPGDPGLDLLSRY